MNDERDALRGGGESGDGGGGGPPRKRRPSWLRRIAIGVAVSAAIVTVACTGAGIYVWYTVTPVVKGARLVYSVVKYVKYILY